MTKTAILTEANTNIGYGHLYRAIALAQELILNNFEVDFFCDGPYSNKIVSDILHGIKIFDTSELDNLVHNYNILIIDVYKSTWKNYQWLAHIAQLYTVSIIDFAFREYSIPTDYIFQIGFQEYSFKKTIKHINGDKESKVFSGNSFFIFRNEFKNTTPFKIRKDANRILISMGGSDPYNLTEFVSESLIEIQKTLDISIIFGAGIDNIRQSKIKSSLKSSVHVIKFYDNVNNIAKLYLESDLAIINGGNTRFELASLGIPFISISFNEKQNRIANSLQSNGVGENLGVYNNLNKSFLSEYISNTIDNYDKRKLMSEQMRNKFNTEGRTIIVKAILKEL